MSTLTFSERMAEFVMVEIESKNSEKREIVKPGWVKRRLIWPLKTKLLRTLPFKVDRRASYNFSIFFVQVFLIGVGVSLYLMDVGLDVDSCIRWATMNGCFRL